MRALQLGASSLADVFERPVAALARYLVLIRNTSSKPVESEHALRRTDRATKFVLPQRGAERLDLDGFPGAGPVELDARDFLSALSKRIRPALGRRIKIAMQVEAVCPPCHVDARAFEAAVLHLAMNARDAMPRGGRLTFDIRSGALTNGGPAVSVSVCDNGTGMQPVVAQQAADPLFTTKRGDSAGLGLSDVEGFVSRCGGDMRLRTLVGLGTTVTLNLPCRSSLQTSS